MKCSMLAQYEQKKKRAQKIRAQSMVLEKVRKQTIILLELCLIQWKLLYYHIYRYKKTKKAYSTKKAWNAKKPDKINGGTI